MPLKSGFLFFYVKKSRISFLVKSSKNPKQIYFFFIHEFILQGKNNIFLQTFHSQVNIPLHQKDPLET